MSSDIEILTRLYTILDSINKSIPRTSIYVAIGSACYPKQRNDGLWVVSENNEQQFPNFLKKLKTECFIDPLHIILIDQNLEDPPFITCNSSNIMNDCWIKNSNNYYNPDTNIYVYAVRSYVKYCPYEFNISENIDITKFFEKLNNYSIENNWFTVVQDYSGSNIGLAGEYFDKSLIGHENHIIYGIWGRHFEGCFLDLTHVGADFIYELEDYSRITVFNPATYVGNIHKLKDKINYYKSIKDVSDNDKRNYDILVEQITKYLENKRKIITGQLFQTLRQIKSLIDGNIIDICNIFINDVQIINNLVSFTDCTDGHVFIKTMLMETRYTELYDILEHIFIDYLIEYISYFGLDEIFAIKIYQNMLSIEDCHNWLTFLKKELIDIEKTMF